MTTATIQVRAISVKNGVRNGNSWQRTSLQDRRGAWYATFDSSKTKGINKGDFVDLEYTEGKIVGSFDITRVIGIKASTSSQQKTAEKLVEPGSNYQIVMDSALEKAIEEKISKRLRRAKECVDRELPEAREYSDYYAIVSECLHQFYGEEASLAIAKSRERR